MLVAYKDGNLSGTTMPGVVKTLSNDEIGKISDYIEFSFRQKSPTSFPN